MNNTYFIGGSPCSGKSTVSEALCKKYNLQYFKVDDYLDKYLELGAQRNRNACQTAHSLSPDKLWMRNPQVQCEEELLIYQEIMDFILEDLEALPQNKPILTEGAAFLPCLMNKINIPRNRYLSLTPTREFQIFHYKQREWVPYVLEGCTDKPKAFSNWMERDVLFAEDVRKQCQEYDYYSIVNNGEISIAKLIQKVSEHFELKK